MGLNKNSIKIDGVGDLYRCASMLAKKKVDLGLMFFEKAENKIGGLIGFGIDKERASEDNLYWAEKVLDEYMRLKRKF